MGFTFGLMAAHLYEYTDNHGSVHITWGNGMVCELYLNKADTKKKREEAAEDEKVAMYIRIVIRIKAQTTNCYPEFLLSATCALMLRCQKCQSYSFRNTQSS